MSSIGAAVTDQENLTDMVWANAERFADAVVFRRRENESWRDVTAREFAGQVLDVARGLIAAGHPPGARIPTGGAGYDWVLAQFGVWTSGGVPVPGADPVVPGRLAEAGRAVDERVAHARRLAVGATDPATAEASHGELLAAVRGTVLRRARLFGVGSSMLIRLPVEHPLARLMVLCGVYTRTTLAIGRDADLGSYRPTVVVAEPDLLERVHDAARNRARAEDRGRLFAAAEAVAVEYSRSLDRTGPGITLLGKHMAANRLVYPKVRAALGGRCTAVLCPGEPVDPRLRHFFRGIGIAVQSV
ncbi:MAG TPA: hypothetical protein VFV67_25335 [Actinophytocola sp.]|uniref:hypothetical protein n=1 Tax=Actinophytocola sp. TaxID=1872138 RepID=UPI002DBC39AA|nr:hypothetical protein [Actinophytocola sp.]HEU5473983.1 hypothetical protein [Actinophytocola sp.]